MYSVVAHSIHLLVSCPSPSCFAGEVTGWARLSDRMCLSLRNVVIVRADSTLNGTIPIAVLLKNSCVLRRNQTVLLQELNCRPRKLLPQAGARLLWPIGRREWLATPTVSCDDA